MSKKLLTGIAVLVAGYVAASPYITVHQLKAAAEKRDAEAIAEHVDFPSVRQSLKDQMNAAFLKEMAADEGMQGNSFAVLGTAFAGVMIDKAVDAYITPAGLAQLMAGEKPKPGAGENDSGKTPFGDAAMSYEAYDKFHVTVNGADGEQGKFVLRRQGLGHWKITDIIIPLGR